ncbi:tRNA-dependent cyclodipeptide synthase [Streptomyces sp. MUM 203J]|uniref:tRNA-dependent cyclodipeptide synthase n=1 Tax=Streptomyces sp. MUM 203J TaxID=2791990 RepID=UPI001F048526|nr:tRNA-dependent cyclodipeptide synthase [Streptomyces sp. MUM 203J]MCH0539054.1 tRNA-dependent cyclodipeptide synthase [Streptomyces sp. MUM 203J]
MTSSRRSAEPALCAGNPRVVREHSIRRRLAADADSRAACDALTAGFLATKGPVTEERKRVCLDYVCAEIPLFLDTPAILGVPSSLNGYHQLLPMAELLYSRGAGLRASRNQGHAVVTPRAAEGDTQR